MQQPSAMEAKSNLTDADAEMINRFSSCVDQFASSLKEMGIPVELSSEALVQKAMETVNARLEELSIDNTTDSAELRQVPDETEPPQEAFIPRLEKWCGEHGIDFGQMRVQVYFRVTRSAKIATVFLSFPGEKTFEMFQCEKPDELFDQITKRCESYIPVVPASKDHADLMVMNLPSNDLAYTNAVYINDLHLEKGNLLFPATTTHVKVNDSRIFQLVKSPLVQIGSIAMSSLQRDSFVPQLPLAQLAKVSPCDIDTETKVADVLNIEFEPVANFRVDVDPLAMIDFLRTEFKGCIVYPGTKLAHNKFANRVFRFCVTSGEGRIDDSTQMYWRVHPKSKDVVNIVHRRLYDKDMAEALDVLSTEWDSLQVQMRKVHDCIVAVHQIAACQTLKK